MEEILKDVNKNTKISDSNGNWFTVRQVYGLLAKWNPKTKEYCRDIDLISGRKTLKDTNGYEEYCTREDLKELAQAEGNLLYLAQRKK